MKDRIRANINDPEKLEQLFQENKKAFESGFEENYSQIEGSRLGTFGITPNRLAVLGSNLLILGNLVLIIIALYRIIFRTGKIEKVSQTISKYLPLYIIWLLLVIFGFPLIFGVN